MKKLISILLLEKLDPAKDFGTLILRLGVGLLFMYHGFGKLFGGPEVWEKVGGAMGNLGIGFAPTFWGLMAALSEFGGGFLLVIGLFSRLSAASLVFTMIVALTTKDSFGDATYPTMMLMANLALVFIGAGKYALEQKFLKNKS